MSRNPCCLKCRFDVSEMSLPAALRSAAFTHALSCFLLAVSHCPLPYCIQPRAAGELQQPTEVRGLPVFPKGLRKGRCYADERRGGGTSKLQWARNKGDSAPYEVSPALQHLSGPVTLVCLLSQNMRQ